MTVTKSKSLLMSEELEIRLGKIESIIFKAQKQEKSIQFCGSSFNKLELMHLFYLLMDENILFFDATNSVNNRAQLQLFVGKHFTYSGKDAIQCKIEGVSRYFSEAKGYVYRERHLQFIEKLKQILEQRRLRIIK